MKQNKINAFKKTELFKNLNDRAIRSLAETAVERRLRRNEILFIAGEEADKFYVIASGAIRAFRTGSNGREQILHVEHAPATIGEVPIFDDGAYPSTTAAEEDTVLYALDKIEILRLCRENPQIALAALKVLSRRLRTVIELIENLSLGEVRQRVARLLLAEARTNGKRANENQIRFQLKLTKTQIAARVGTVREVVSRVLTRMQAEEIIRWDNTFLTVLDENGLVKCAGEMPDTATTARSV